MKQTKKTLSEKHIMWRTLRTDQSPMAKAKRSFAKQFSKMCKDLVGVQPMQGPAGEIFSMNYRSGDDDDV